MTLSGKVVSLKRVDIISRDYKEVNPNSRQIYDLQLASSISRFCLNMCCEFVPSVLKHLTLVHFLTHNNNIINKKKNKTKTHKY